MLNHKREKTLSLSLSLSHTHTQRRGAGRWGGGGGGGIGSTLNRKVTGSTGAAGTFSPGSTFCADFYFDIRSTPVLPQ